MRGGRSAAAFVALGLAFAVPAAHADDKTADVAVTGAVSKPLTLTMAALAAMPQTKLHVSFNTSHGAETADFAGVPLWTLLQQAGLVDGPAKGAHLRHGILVTAADGYGVLLSLGELDPDFANVQAILAVSRDGEPLKEGIRLVVPGDKKGGRSVREVTKIEVD